MFVDFSCFRERMVNNQIKTFDVQDHSVLSAFLTIPREVFVPEKFKDIAYSDESFMILSEEGKPARYMMPPAALARLMQLADIDKNDFILNVGANMGYCAALLAQLGKFVIALEENAFLHQFSKKQFQHCEYNRITPILGSMTAGFAAKSPYDVIFIEGAVDYVPECFFEQLGEGGRLVVVEGRGASAVACLYVKQGTKQLLNRAFNLCAKSLPGFLNPEKFTL